ncbi:MAG: DUF5107 domain-containing protein [Clostridiales bacterium]|nr:DUF5107 domain-containing protein [Clostridiales bacterium]
MNKVKAYTKSMIIPTYEPGEAQKLPMFLENRTYQGSGGRIYPYPMTETISDTLTDKEYEAVCLENEYLLVVILPELGGRVWRIYDKLNECDALYYNKTIKPALAGLAGPWIAGGIEFSWPQHHRPSTFERIDCCFKENADGSATVYTGEIERMGNTKGMTAFTLYPEKAYLEVKGQIYNPTERMQTFSWWSNAAVSINENTRLILPPDVNTVSDYGQGETAKYPIATDEYCGGDYGEGVDISRHKNVTVPTAFMACSSEFDFIGSYDDKLERGFLHIADHHISPGKKQWLWGSGEYGRAWNRALCDSGEGYAELMAGMYAGNQPDFTFIAPYEEKCFKEYFMPYMGTGGIKNASASALVNMEIKGQLAHIAVYAPSKLKARITLKGKVVEYLDEATTLLPGCAYKKEVDIEEEKAQDITLTVFDDEDNVLVSYTPAKKQSAAPLKKPEKIKKPEDIYSLEELYLTALHAEQNRCAGYSPEAYYIEGLRRDKTDIRLNNGYGKYLYHLGRFEEAREHFEAAIAKASMINPNPYDSEPYYNLGITLKALNRTDEAYDAIYKSVWSSGMQDRGFYQLACICSTRGEYEKALDFLRESLGRGYHNIKARNLMTALLRLTGKTENAQRVAKKTIKIDPMDCGARYELYRLTGDFAFLNELTSIMRNELHNYIELSINYSEAGLFEEAAKILAIISQADKRMLHYYIAYYSNSSIELEVAQGCSDDYVFVSRLYDIRVLEYVIKNNPKDEMAPYYLGNLFYDKGQYERAARLWKQSLGISSKNTGALRNLAIAYFNHLNEPDKAMTCMEKAQRLDPGNPRLLYELDCIRKEMNYPILKRAVNIAKNQETAAASDELYMEFITLVNSLKQYDKALGFIKAHRFHPWEGAEGKISAQYKRACIGMAKRAIKKNDCEGAVEFLKQAMAFPQNLGEGRREGQTDNDVYYYLGCAYENVDKIVSIEYFNKALCGENVFAMPLYSEDISPDMTYYRALAYEKLGDSKSARKIYNKMINYAQEHINDCFEDGVLLPRTDIFNMDLEKMNFVHCAYLAALGCKGLGDTKRSEEYRKLGLERDNSHQGLLDMTETEDEESVNYEKWAKWKPTV